MSSMQSRSSFTVRCCARLLATYRSTVAFTCQTHAWCPGSRAPPRGLVFRVAHLETIQVWLAKQRVHVAELTLPLANRKEQASS